MSRDPEASIIFPVHNEEGNIDELVLRVNKTLEDYFGIADAKAQNFFEIIFVDDASTDESLRAIKRHANDFSHVRYVHHEQGRGQTGAFKSGFDAARGKVVITMDADLEVLPEDIPLFLDQTRRGFEMVNGIRIERKHKAMLKLQSRIYNMLMRVFFWSPFTDNASNFTAVKSSFVKDLPLTDNDHRYLYPILKTRGLSRCTEVPVRHVLRRSGVSKYSNTKAIKGAVEFIPAWIRIRTGRYRK